MSLRACSLLSLLVVTSTIAFASFDLTLIPQVGSGRINRFDPVSNVSLGSFGVPAAANVTVDQVNNRVFVSDATSGFIRSYNYNTGAALTSYCVGTNPVHMAYNSSTNSIFYINALGGLGRLNAATGVITPVTGIAGMIYRTLATRDGVVSFIGTTAANESSYLAINATSLAIQDTINLSNFVLPFSRMGKAVLIPGVSSGYIFRYSFIDSVSTLRIAQGTTSSVGFLDNHTNTLLTGFGTTVMPSIVPGHTGYFIAGQDSTTSTNLRMDGYSTRGALLHQTQTPGYTFASSNFGADNIVAPEPGTMIAIGVGLAAMLKRRKKTL